MWPEFIGAGHWGLCSLNWKANAADDSPSLAAAAADFFIYCLTRYLLDQDMMFLNNTEGGDIMFVFLYLFFLLNGNAGTDGNIDGFLIEALWEFRNYASWKWCLEPMKICYKQWEGLDISTRGDGGGLVQLGINFQTLQNLVVSHFSSCHFLFSVSIPWGNKYAKVR